VAYEIAVIMMGGEKTVSRFLMALQKKPRGRPKGSTDPEGDQILLAFYDWLEAHPDQLAGCGKTPCKIRKRIDFL
jgi:hypothetical protein